MYQKGTLYASMRVLGKYPSVIIVHHVVEKGGNMIARKWENSCCAHSSRQAVDQRKGSPAPEHIRQLIDSRWIKVRVVKRIERNEMHWSLGVGVTICPMYDNNCTSLTPELISFLFMFFRRTCQVYWKLCMMLSAPPLKYPLTAPRPSNWGWPWDKTTRKSQKTNRPPPRAKRTSPARTVTRWRTLPRSRILPNQKSLQNSTITWLPLMCSCLPSSAIVTYKKG